MKSPFACRAMRLAQHPSKPDTIYCALEFGGAMVSHDSGQSWNDCGDPLVEMSKLPHLSSQIATDKTSEGMLDGHALTIAAADPDAVVIALRMGLFETRDGGKTWQDKEAYDAQARMLAGMFVENFEQFKEGLPEEVYVSGPTI